MPGELLGDDALTASAVVANAAMNRERQLAGVNSYTRELGFNPLDWLVAGLPRPGGGEPAGSVSWLDLCCGTGRCLIQAAGELGRAGLAGRVRIVGVDLVPMFEDASSAPATVELVCDSVTSWTPPHRFDLVTCVHGLHYVRDKLGLLTRAAGWLTADGQLFVHLDAGDVRLAGGRPAGRGLTSALRRAGFAVNHRRHLVSRTGPGAGELPYDYLGADDRAGPNYTGQPAIHSYYAERR